MVIGNTSFISDSVKYIRDTLASGIVDPLSSARPQGQRFVMTSYPQRNTTYPIITVRVTGVSQVQQLGFYQTGMVVKIPVEVRVWARNQKEKDTTSEQVYSFLRNNQYQGQSGTTASLDFGIYDLRLTGMVDVDEDGDNAVKSKVMYFDYNAILT